MVKCIIIMVVIYGDGDVLVLVWNFLKLVVIVRLMCNIFVGVFGFGDCSFLYFCGFVCDVEVELEKVGWVMLLFFDIVDW